jgi:hypothetical protein
MQRRHVCALIGFAALVLIPSCGPSRGDVTGLVTYNGKALTHGVVIFIGSDGIPVQAQIGEDGKYKAQGVMYGDAFVAVMQSPKGAKSPAEVRKEYNDKKAKGEEVEEPTQEELMAGTVSTIPKVYSNTATSELKVMISQPLTTYDIPLVDKSE